jgi:preprotein translocase SecE subunit
MLLRKLREIPNVKKVFVRSGIRYDYLMYDKDDTFFKELIQHHISGQLKVAPEHIAPKVLDKMGKPRKDLYMKFVESVKESYNELVHKTSWPSRKELTQSAVIVLIASIILSLIVWLMDWCFESIMTFVYGLF